MKNPLWYPIRGRYLSINIPSGIQAMNAEVSCQRQIEKEEICYVKRKCDNYVDKHRNGGRSQTWDNIARWTEGILNLEKDMRWSDLEQKNQERRNKYLKKICAVNLKKTPGKHTSNNININFEANQNTEILRRQLKLYDADIIICCGTGAQYLKYI